MFASSTVVLQKIPFCFLLGAVFYIPGTWTCSLSGSWGEMTEVAGGGPGILGKTHAITGQQEKETSWLSLVAIKTSLNSKVRKLKSLSSAWKLFKKL